ncbi:unnamed protein product, partial [Mesorhabditis spiculigera]
MLKFVVTVLLLASVQGFCGKEQLESLADCYQDFFNFYKIKTTDKFHFPDYWTAVHQTRGRILQEQGKAIQPQVCQAAVKLAACVAKKPYDSLCFLGFALNLTEANDYITDIAVGNYQCTDGYATLLQDFECLGKTRDTYHVPLQACSDNFNYALDHGGDICPAMNTFLTCQQPYYANSCGFNAGVWICGTNRAGILANSDYCLKLGQLNECPPYR